MSYFIEWGYWGMFLAAMLAATILPFSSEVVLAGLLTIGMMPSLLLLYASIGNILGAIINYLLGYRFGKSIALSVLRMSPKQFARSQTIFERWGKWSLILCWVPVIGDPLTLLSGVLRINKVFFVCVVSIVKTLRYAAIIYWLT
ncbi:YqaA family protein [Alteromonas profundi]